jgi:hypothetical protein
MRGDVTSPQENYQTHVIKIEIKPKIRGHSLDFFLNALSPPFILAKTSGTLPWIFNLCAPIHKTRYLCFIALKLIILLLMVLVLVGGGGYIKPPIVLHHLCASMMWNGTSGSITCWPQFKSQQDVIKKTILSSLSDND